MSKHFKMYITINNSTGEKRIDLAYRIRGKEVTVVSVFSDNIQYKFTEAWAIDLELSSKLIVAGTYMRCELIDLVKGKIEITQFDKDSRINRTNKLEGITEIVFNLNELDNSNNLESRTPSNTLHTYHVNVYDDSTHFEPYAPHYKKLKNEEIMSLTLRIKNMKNNIITDGTGTTVVLHV